MATKKTKAWSTVPVSEVVRTLQSDVDAGLDALDIERSRKRYGKNILGEPYKLGVLLRVLKQFKSPLVLILIAAGTATFFLQEYVDTIVIAFAVFVNIAIGFFQEERAGRAFETLVSGQQIFATVMRGGAKHVIPQEDVVVGDIVFIEGGESVPADMRLVHTKNLSINESALTGEWASVSKDTEVIKGERAITDQRNMAWKGTLVATGDGVGIVVAVGLNTQVGAIASELQRPDSRPTPLQGDVQRIARFLMIGITVAIGLIFAIGIFRGESLVDMAVLAVAVAVASMPEGLPAAVTVALALGMESILKRGGLVRNLLAAETLGATTIILTDKTGTLTEGRMTVGAALSYARFKFGEGSKQDAEDEVAIINMSLCASNAFFEEEEANTEQLNIYGEPMERAMLLAAIDRGVAPEDTFYRKERIDYMRFESERRYAAGLTQLQGVKRKRVCVNGSPELIIGAATSVFVGGKTQKMTPEIAKQFNRILDRTTRDGKRLLAVGYKDVSWKELPEDEQQNKGEDQILKDITFAGFIIFTDPVRVDVADSIRTVHNAGARVILLTGDNAGTARRVAMDTGVAGQGEKALIGTDIEKLGDEELYEALKDTHVFARVLPDQKLRIARVLKERGEIVAMTGDGVNDAPALFNADIGVAVGSGTDVAKESADLVLLDDSFTIITSAIEEGRRIIDNLRKIVAYLLSTSFSEVILIGGSLVVGAPIPILPTQILWSNFVEEGFMSFAFAFEKSEEGVMRRNPRSVENTHVLTKEVGKLIWIISVTTGILLLGLYFLLLSYNLPADKIRTIMFSAVSVDSIFFAFSFKNLHLPVWRINPFTNRYLLIALMVSVTVLISARTVPFLQDLLSLTPMTFNEFVAIFAVGLINLTLIEVVKRFFFGAKAK